MATHSVSEKGQEGSRERRQGEKIWSRGAASGSEAEKVSFNFYPFLIPLQKVGNIPSATIFFREF